MYNVTLKTINAKSEVETTSYKDVQEIDIQSGFLKLMWWGCSTNFNVDRVIMFTVEEMQDETD